MIFSTDHLKGRIGIIMIILLMIHSSCQSPRSQQNKTGGKLTIVTTTMMLEDAVINIAKDSVVVEAMMGPGVDPHLYKATQGDLQKLSDADLIIYNGLFLEGKMEDILERLGKIKPTLAAAEIIDKSKIRDNPFYPGTYDPHIWFDVQLWRVVVQNVNQALQQHDPKNATYYQSNAIKFLKSLDSLHLKVRDEIQKIPDAQRVLVTAHDAFGYFGEAYKLEVKGLQGISTQSEFGLRDITDLVKYIVNNKIKAVFIESSVSPRAINAVVEGCKERGFAVDVGGILFSDAMGEKGTPEGTYKGMVHANVQTIVEALK